MDSLRRSVSLGRISQTGNGVESSIPTVDNLGFQGRTIVAERYEVLRRLGKGGMGEVWHAYDVKLRVEVALKSLRSDLRKNERTVEALRREVRTAREVISPNVCRIFDLVVEADQELISMEYIDGITLMSMLLQNGSLELRDARDIAAQFLAGLEAIHQVGLVHRDLKPENIMITRTGRVVVMDFGIAKLASESQGGTISGTPPYMAPEQFEGAQLDARSDLYSAGVILAEMIHPEGILSQKTREQIWDALRHNPREIPDSPWKAIILRTVSNDPTQRFPSASALSRALEEATQRVETIDEQKPYPGLASFTPENAEYFFGREMEVETLIRKLQELQMMALVGPSGAGKTSFLRAGLLPALPADWQVLFTVPGDAPFLNVGQALIPEFSGNTEAMQQMLRFEDLSVAVKLLSQWRRKHAQALLIVDRFEELFTLNTHEVQSRFAELISKAALEADVRVLLAMRDDFLLRCHDYPSLAPIFSELTPLGALTGPSLRRALVQPALKCGYRFEDDILVDEILNDLEKERGALPLMAFAAASLWEKRDRKSGELTRESYKQIGGVAGALAQHAERTMDRIGSERQPLVREIFRNLITAENTRIARDAEELLTVFPDRIIAEEVLRMLVDARLLTSFEAASNPGEKPRRRVEIIHESLLSAWPRLVRWQTQDADSAQLRDQLRQAAQLWEQRSRSEDLLWTGTAYLEFHAWRQRYPGGLTSTEDAFAQAMVRHATQQRRRRRRIISTTFVILLAVLILISNLWRKETLAKKEAVLQAKRAEAGNVLTIGRSSPEADASTKLAYALASLEFTDTSQGRIFALQALAEGATAHVFDLGKRMATVEFSPDGRWLAAAPDDGSILLYSGHGGAPITVQPVFRAGNYVQWPSQFSADSKFLVWTVREHVQIVKIWSLVEKKVVRTFEFEGRTLCLVRGPSLFLISDKHNLWEGGWSQTIVRRWNFDSQEPKILGTLNFTNALGPGQIDIDPAGQTVAYVRNKDICVRSLNEKGLGAERVTGKHPAPLLTVKANADRIVSVDETGEIRLWSSGETHDQPLRTLHLTEPPRKVLIDPAGSHLYAVRSSDMVRWDLTTFAEPQFFKYPGPITSILFHPKGGWIAAQGGSTIAFFSLAKKDSYEFKNVTSNVRFTPDGKFFFSSFSGNVIRLTNFPGHGPAFSRSLWNSKKWEEAPSIDLDPTGKLLLFSAFGEGLHLVTLQDGRDTFLQSVSSEQWFNRVAISPNGRLALGQGNEGIEVWDLESRNSRLLKSSKGPNFDKLLFSSQGELIAGDKGKVYQIDINNDYSEVLLHTKHSWVSGLAFSPDGKLIALATVDANNVFELPNATSELLIFQRTDRKSSIITSHGNRVFSVAFSQDGTKIITGDIDGIVRVGSIKGDIPYFLLGHKGLVSDIVVHPSGSWIATSADDAVRFWLMPKGNALNSLAHDDFLKHLRTLSNVRAVQDQRSPTGYRIEYPPFSGWQN